jgi:hypothetical protein
MRGVVINGFQHGIALSVGDGNPCAAVSPDSRNDLVRPSRRIRVRIRVEDGCAQTAGSGVCGRRYEEISGSAPARQQPGPTIAAAVTAVRNLNPLAAEMGTVLLLCLNSSCWRIAHQRSLGRRFPPAWRPPAFASVCRAWPSPNGAAWRRSTARFQDDSRSLRLRARRPSTRAPRVHARSDLGTLQRDERSQCHRQRDFSTSLARASHDLETRAGLPRRPQGRLISQFAKVSPGPST